MILISLSTCRVVGYPQMIDLSDVSVNHLPLNWT